MKIYYRPVLIPHYSGGKDGWTPDQGWTITRRGDKSYVLLGQPEEPTTHRPYWVTSRTKLLDYGDLEKGYTAVTAGMLPNVLTAARNFAQGDLERGFINLGWTNDVQTAPDGTQYAVVAPGILDAAPFKVGSGGTTRRFIGKGEQGMPTSAMIPVEEAGLSVRNVSPVAYENPVTNPAERQAALDFLKENPLMKDLVETKIRPGISEDWEYPYKTKVKYGMRKPVTSTNKYTRQTAEQTVSTQTAAPPAAPQPVQRPVIKLKEGVKGDYRKTYLKNRADDKAAGISRLARRNFLLQVALESGDMRAANPGRPRERDIRDMFDNMQRYPASVQKGLDKILLSIAKSAAKLGLRPSREEMYSYPQVKAYLKKQHEILKAGLLNKQP